MNTQQNEQLVDGMKEANEPKMANKRKRGIKSRYPKSPEAEFDLKKSKKAKKLTAKNERKRARVTNEEATLRKKAQDGGGKTPEEFQKKDHFPTEEEKAYFFKYVKLSKEVNLKRQNSVMQNLPAMTISFVKLDEILYGSPLHEHVAKLIDILIRLMIQKAGGSLKDTCYWLQMKHRGYYQEEGFIVKHKTYAAVDGGVIMNQLASQMQSNKNIAVDESFTVSMNFFESVRPVNPKAVIRGSKRFSGRGSRTAVKIKNSLMEANFGIKQNRVIGNSHCLPKAIVLGKLESDKKCATSTEERKRLEKNYQNLTDHRVSLQYREKKQLELAKQLLTKAGMDQDEEDHHLDDLQQLADHMPDYQIVLWKIEGRQTVAAKTAHYNKDGTRFIGLFYHNHHYECVTHVVGTKPARFCYKCGVFSDDNHDNQCAARCRRCGMVGCGPGDSKVHCRVCNINFRNRKCFDAHRKSTSGHAYPYCEKYFRCKKCLRIDQTEKFRGEPHICGATKFCRTCAQKVKPRHSCCYPIPTKKQKLRNRRKQRNWTIVVYDVECIVAESGEFRGDITRGPEHLPNFICARMFCSVCRGKKPCEKCMDPWHYSYKDDTDAGRRNEDGCSEEIDGSPFEANKLFGVEERTTPIARFAKFLLTDPRVNKAYIIAHNGGGYDHAMVLAELDRQAGVKCKGPKAVFNGMRIVTAKFRYKKQTLFFRDTLLYLPMPLSKMPEAFELEGEVKGFYPYLYNHPDNYDKELPALPPKEYYSPEYMSPEVRKEFEKWYEEAFNDGFNLYRDTFKYCDSDVRILTQTLIKYIELCADIFNGWNPIVQGCTLASYVMFVLKNEFIKKGDVGYVPENGFGSDTNSMLALKYIQWLEKQAPTLKLQYMLRGGEFQIHAAGHQYKVDAYNKDTKEVYEIYGCLWHGCPKCQPIRDKKNQLCDRTPQELYDRTMKREEDIREAGCTVHSIWECEIYDMMDSNPQMKEFFSLNKYTRRLNPREAVFGGRTQAFRSITRATEEETIEYMDFVSMYPYLNAGGTAYPRGNPTVLVDDELPPVNQPLTLRGLVFCDCLPPTDAEMGYLPGRFNQKLMFPLCRTCAEDQSTWKPCTHTRVSQRFLTGVWTTDELNKAISRGYNVLRYHEIWFWEEEDWVKGGFFAPYIKRLLKIKYESSGWPKENMSEEEKEEYVANILKNDDVQLDDANIKKNKGLRSLSKIFLNCAWGKFAQNPIRNEARLVLNTDGEAFAEFFNHPKYEPTGMVPFGEHKTWILRKPKRESARGAPFTNLPIAAQTTAAARLRLTEGIERVGVENMIYCDTDSLMFKQKIGEDPLGDLKGEHLGFMVSEIPEGKAITEAVVMAPKAYSIQIREEATGEITHTTKAKGITLHCENRKNISHEGMRNAMEDYIEYGVANPLEGEMLTFKRGAHPLDVLTTCVTRKELKPHMDKGHYIDGVSIPYGRLAAGAVLEDDYPFY